MRWLIVEDSLKNRKGHWFEYISSFHRELRTIGDEVTVWADAAAEPFIVEHFEARPVLPPSIWHRMGDGAGALRRYARVPLHAWQTRWKVGRALRQEPEPDVVFVPTMLVHHLLGWTWLIKRRLNRSRTRVLLFFPHTPVRLDPATGEPHWDPSPTARLFVRLVRSLQPEIAAGRVVLGVETQPMRAAMTRLARVPFTYFPHPVVLPETCPRGREVGARIVVGSYGSARHEKGTDVLVDAVAHHLAHHPDTRLHFVLQVVDSFTDSWKRLEGHPQVELVTGYFGEGQYQKQLLATDALLLPYRASSYALRVSRVVIEALVNGFPVVVTGGTTLADQAIEFGAALTCRDGDASTLAATIEELERRYDELRPIAASRAPLARSHFSVRTFRDILMNGTAAAATAKGAGGGTRR